MTTESVLMHNRELVAIIRKMVADNTDDILHLPRHALWACDEIERLSKELEYLRRFRNGS
jgi:hypothetical protein